jgi:hypothetical protein
MAIVETQGRIARGGEGKQSVVPVMNAQDLLGVESCHMSIRKMLVMRVIAWAQRDFSPPGPCRAGPGPAWLDLAQEMAAAKAAKY